VRELIQLIHKELQERGLPRLTLRDANVPEVEGKIFAIIGMRRTGKTYFLYQKMQERLDSGTPWSSILYLNCEDDRLQALQGGGLAEAIEAFYALYPENHRRRVFLFLDEIQNVRGWPEVLRRFLDTRDVRIFVTGSSARLLAKEIASSLRGRSLSVEIAPFSFAERLRFQGDVLPTDPRALGPAARNTILDRLRTHALEGGFPETLGLELPARREILRNYVDVVILRDIVERHGVSNVALVRYLIRTLLATAGSLFTVNKFFRDLKSQGIAVAKGTIHEFLAYVEDAFLAFLVPIAADSIRKRQVNPRKVYAVDPGLVRVFTFQTENRGALFENLLHCDLRRFGCELAYHLTRSGREVDFVATFPDGRRRLYQAAFDVSEASTLRREELALEEAKQELGLEGCLVTVENYLTDFLPEIAGTPLRPSPAPGRESP
jgi:hypothetical protein